MRPALALSMRFSRDAIGGQTLQYLFPGFTATQQIPHMSGTFDFDLAVPIRRPFASRFRVCVSRVAGALFRARFVVIDQSVWAMVVGEGETALFAQFWCNTFLFVS